MAMDYKAHFGVTDNEPVLLTEENCPAGTIFVSRTNKLFRVDGWETTPDGKKWCPLASAAEGSLEFDGQPTKWDKDPLPVWLVSKPEPEVEDADIADLGEDLSDLEETPGTDVPDDFDTEIEPAADEQVEDEETAAEMIDEKIDVPVEEDLADGAADDDELFGNSEGLDGTPSEQPEDDGIPAPAASESATKQVHWDGAPNAIPAVIFECAKRQLTVQEIAYAGIDKRVWTEPRTAINNVRRNVRRLITLGYGLMFIGDPDTDKESARVALTHDGVTPLPVTDEVYEDNEKIIEEAALMGQIIRKRLGFKDIADLPAPLAAALSGIDLNQLGLSPQQLQGIVLKVVGEALIMGAKV